MIQAVDKARAAWLTSLGLLGAGWMLAHVVSYRIMVPDATERGRMLLETGHGYFRIVDLLILCLTLTVAGIAACVLTRADEPQTPSPWLLTLLPLIGFAIQEHVERLPVDGALPTHLVTEPRFLLGLLLQVPFALAALVFARLLDTAARGLVLRGGGSARPVLVLADPTWAPTVNARRPRISALALRHGERAPPFATTR